RITNAHWRIEYLFCDLSHAVQQRTTAGQHDTARELSFPARVFDLVGDVHQHFFSTRLKDVAEDLTRELAWWTSTDRRHIDELTALHLTQRAAARAADCALDLLGFRNRRAKTESDVVREVRAAERENCRVLNSAALVNDQPGRLCAYVDQCCSKLFVIFS